MTDSEKILFHFRGVVRHVDDWTENKTETVIGRWNYNTPGSLFGPVSIVGDCDAGLGGSAGRERSIAEREREEGEIE